MGGSDEAKGSRSALKVILLLDRLGILGSHTTGLCWSWSTERSWSGSVGTGDTLNCGNEDVEPGCNGPGEGQLWNSCGQSSVSLPLQYIKKKVLARLDSLWKQTTIEGGAKALADTGLLSYIDHWKGRWITPDGRSREITGLLQTLAQHVMNLVDDPISSVMGRRNPPSP